MAAVEGVAEIGLEELEPPRMLVPQSTQRRHLRGVVHPADGGPHPIPALQQPPYQMTTDEPTAPGHQDGRLTSRDVSHGETVVPAGRYA